MKKVFVLLIGLILLFSCRTVDNNLTGLYVSECILYGYPERVISIQDTTYITTHTGYAGVLGMGEWYQKGDTIFFKERYDLRRAKDNSIEKIEIEESTGFEEFDIKGFEELLDMDMSKYSLEIKGGHLIGPIPGSCKLKKRKNLKGIDTDSLMINYYLPLRKDVSE